MDTKLKKSKLIISFLSFFIGINLLLSILLTGVYYFDHSVFEWKDITKTDYQETSEFAYFISSRLQIFIEMATGEEIEKYYNSYYGYAGNALDFLIATYEVSETSDGTAYSTDTDEEPDNTSMAQAFHESNKHDKNLIYSIAYEGKILYANDEEFAGNLTDASSLPAGYNFWLCLDNGTVTIQKDGTTIDIYGDGYYRDDSVWYVPGYKNIPVSENLKNVTIYMAAAGSPVPYSYGKYGDGYYRRNSNSIYDIYRHTQIRMNYLNLAVTFAAVTAALLLIAMVLRKNRKDFLTMIAFYERKIFLELRLCLYGIVTFVMYAALYLLASGLLDWQYYNAQVFAFFITAFWVLYFLWNDFWKNRPLWKQSLLYRIVHHMRYTVPQKINAMKLPYAKRMVLRFLPLLILWGIGLLFAAFLFLTLIADSYRSNEAMLIGLLLLLFAAIVSYPFIMLYRRNMQLAKDLDLLSAKIAAIHSGDYANSCEIAGSSELSPLAEQLDDIRNGMSNAVEERIKSERMKVELITNVSHDLKTPLTSMISYVELLKQENELPDHVKDYIKILEEKTFRLNQMIQDIFAVSKAASGQLPLNMEKIDFAKLLHQTLADMNEQIEDSSFSVKTNIPEEAVIIETDGQRMYRVFQNLIQNALKYSLEGSRIYITLTVTGKTASASVKNTSAMEIDPMTDFSERFVRGDASRSDGGSGLGLSIAKSFTESCGGNFDLNVNADLFTVTISFETIC